MEEKPPRPPGRGREVSNLNIKVKVSAIGGQFGRVEQEAWNAAASLRPSGVQIQIVSQIGVVLYPVAEARPHCITWAGVDMHEVGQF